ncbi:MAG: GGDEF domain-containing protein [Firmicutes bacterium]|nr:GGDEF domain-containing protein [Bacillota bacterium]
MGYEKEFYNILQNENITTLFQPIVNLTNGEVIGYESLSRGPKDSKLKSPLELLKIANKLNKLWDLELLFRKKAIEKAKSINKNKLLFINVDPNIIKDSNFKKGFTKGFLKKNNISPESIIFEITERTAIHDYESFTKILDNYINQGYKIALDDAGAGYSGLKTISETKPHYIKLDMDLIRNIDKDIFKQALIKAFVDLSISTDTLLIAEGIETKEELQTIIRLGVYAGQGYFLQRPAGTFLEISEKKKAIIKSYNRLKSNILNYNEEYHYIGNVIESSETFPSNTNCKEIKNFFDNNLSEGVCIVENEYPVGLIMKHNLFSAMAKQYGYAVYSKRPISLLMDKSPLIVDYYTPIKKVAENALTRPHKKTYDNIIVTKGSKYYGLVSIKKLLQYTTAVEKNYARELNPLTSLPGNVIINRVLKDAVTYSESACLFYLDLDNFKIYNDIYGFENGDKIIKLTAKIIKENVKSICPFNSFVGHVGGDDFVCLIDSPYEDCKKLSENIINEFDEKILDFFNERDKNNKYLKSKDRFGCEIIFNLTSISIAGLYGNIKKFKTEDSLAKHMSKLKKEAKKRQKSSYYITKVAN